MDSNNARGWSAHNRPSSDATFAICGIVAGSQVLTLVIAYVYSTYFNRAAFDVAYLFRAYDPSAVAAGFTELQSLGRHTFGDFAWVFSLTKVEGSGGYFGAAQVFLLLTSDLPVLASLTTMNALAFFAVWTGIRIAEPSRSASSRLLIMISMFIGVQPVLLAMDRGQVHLIMVAMLILSITMLAHSGKRRLEVPAAILLGAAISMKLAPIFFLLILLRERSWRLFKVALACLLMFLAAPLAMGKSGLGTLFRLIGMRASTSNGMDSLYTTNEYFEQSRAYNSSFKAFFDVAGQYVSRLGGASSYLQRNYTAFAVMFLMTITVMILSKKVTQIESLALCAVATARLLPIANGYTNAVFLVPLFFLLGHGNENHLSRRNLAVVLFLSVSTMSFQVPIGGGFPSDSVYTYNALVGPVLSLVFVATIGFRLLVHPAHRVFVLSSRVAKSSD